MLVYFQILIPYKNVLFVVSQLMGLGWVGLEASLNWNTAMMKAFVNFHGDLTSFQFTHVPKLKHGTLGVPYSSTPQLMTSTLP
jgi:hypothetical protein